MYMMGHEPIYPTGRDRCTATPKALTLVPFCSYYFQQELVWPGLHLSICVHLAKITMVFHMLQHPMHSPFSLRIAIDIRVETCSSCIVKCGYFL